MCTQIPLPPRSAFGIWWSHYEAYSEEYFVRSVVDGFANLSLPLNHVNFDVDWHRKRGCHTYRSSANPDYAQSPNFVFPHSRLSSLDRCRNAAAGRAGGQNCEPYNGYSWNETLFPDSMSLPERMRAGFGGRVPPLSFGVNTHRCNCALPAFAITFLVTLPQFCLSRPFGPVFALTTSFLTQFPWRWALRIT